MLNIVIGYMKINWCYTINYFSLFKSIWATNFFTKDRFALMTISG